MRVFLAGTGCKPWLKNNYFNFYRLHSYEYLKKEKGEINLIHNYKDFILDSGIFSFLNGKNTSNIDWEKYMNDYADFVRENKIKNYVEMDIESVIGLEETEKLRKRLEKRVGWKSIPVWHMNRGYDKWIEICKEYDYVCFGAFLTDGLKESKFYMIEQFLNDAKKYNCKVHGLGFTNFKYLPKLKFYSVDSSSWTVGNRFGSIEKFEDNKIKHLKRPNGTGIKEHDKLVWHNFKEWVNVDSNIYQWYTDRFKKYHFMRILTSNFISVPLDSAIVTLIAFYGVMPNDVLISITLVNISIKYIITLITVPSIYLVKEKLKN